MKTRILLVLSLLLLCSLNSKVFSQWSTSPFINNHVTTNSGHQTHPKSCSDQDDGAVIVWEDDRNGNSDIYAQRIDKHGNNQWQTGGVKICGASGDQIHPVICTDGNGGAIIAWADDRAGSGDVWAQRVRRDGVIMWADNGVRVTTENTSLATSLVYPAIQHSGSGAIVACNTSHGVKAIKLTAFGEYEWAPISSNYMRTVATGFFINTVAGVEMCPDGGNGAHVCWSGWDGLTNGHKVYAQHLNSDGTNHWSGSMGKRVCNNAQGHQKKPKIVSDEVAGCEIVWEDGRRDTNTVTGRPNHDIYAERLDFFGSNMWNSNGNPICTDTADQTNPSAIADTWEGMHIVWQDFRNYDAGPDSGLGVNLYCQNVHFNGNKRWTHNGVQAAILCDVAKAQDPRYNPQICANDDIGGFMLSWIGYSDTTGATLNNFGIYAQRMSYFGAHQWFPTTPGVSGHPNGARVSLAPGDKHSVTMCNNRTVTDAGGDDSSGAVIAWTDDKNFGSSGEDIYAQHIKSTSDLGDFRAGGNQGTNDKPILNQNRPNPFNPSTVISFNLPKGEFVTVKIFDLLGREVATLINNQMNAGTHSVTWNANGLTSGAYFYKIQAGAFTEIKTMLLVK